MPNLMQTALDFHAAQLGQYASFACVMVRSGVAINVNAALGSQMLRVSDRQGNTKVERTDRDIIPTTAELVAAMSLAGMPTLEPIAGDHWYIDLGDGSGSSQFEVMSPNNEGPWRYCDSYHKRIRIHAKFVTKAEPPGMAPTNSYVDADGSYYVSSDGAYYVYG